MADNGLQVNSVNNRLLTSVAVHKRNTSNPFVQNYSADSFERSASSTFAGNLKTPPVKKSHIDTLKRKFSEFIQYQQFGALANKQEIENMMLANPRIDSILRNSSIPKQICIENLTDIYKEHLAGTVGISKEIGRNMGLSNREMKLLEKGALFHDFGKVLIPKELLNKPGKLTPEERKIVSKHAILGYELLKTTNMEPEVLDIVKNHHKYKSNLEDGGNTKLSQIVTVADIYSALTTQRSYKKALSSDKAIEIIDKLTQEGKLDKDIVDALKMSFQTEKLAA